MSENQFRLFEIIDEFLFDTKYDWSHDDWNHLVGLVEEEGLDINPEELGKMLENEKSKYKRRQVLKDSEGRLKNTVDEMESEISKLKVEKANIIKGLHDFKKRKDIMEQFVCKWEKDRAEFEKEKKIIHAERVRLEEEMELIRQSEKILHDEIEKIEEVEKRVHSKFKGSTKDEGHSVMEKDELHNFMQVLKQKEDRLFHIEKQVAQKEKALEKRERDLMKYDTLLRKKEYKLKS